MKYIVMQVPVKGMKGVVREMPIIFPEALTHALVAAALERHCPELKGSRPVSAGFISSLDVRAACHGKSESLGNLQSRGQVDDQLICTVDYTHGVRDSHVEELIAKADAKRKKEG